MSRPLRIVLLPLLAAAIACGGEDRSTAPAAEPAREAAAPAPEAPRAPDLSQAIVLSLAQFVEKDGKPVPGPARMEFLRREGGRWKATSFEDADSNVFHKVMAIDGADGPVLLSMAGTKAMVKTWRTDGETLVGTTLWEQDFGGKFSRMRDAEVADLDADGQTDIAVATHDQGIVAVLRPRPDGGFAVEQLDAKPDTFVHEIEIGDLDGDGALEVYATPSEPNRLDGSPQKGEVVRYVPSAGGGRAVVADLGDRHAKEILVADVDGDGRDELYVSVEGHTEDDRLVHPVEIRRYDADTAPDAGVVIATLDDRLTRFLTAGDLDGDGQDELVAAAFSSGVWRLSPPAEPGGDWRRELIDAQSAGFEHAAILADLDADGTDELYVASDRHKEVRRYAWDGRKLAREVIYRRPDSRPIFTWNLMPVPIELVPGR